MYLHQALNLCEERHFKQDLQNDLIRQQNGTCKSQDVEEGDKKILKGHTDDLRV